MLKNISRVSARKEKFRISKRPCNLLLIIIININEIVYCSCTQDTKERYWEHQFCQIKKGHFSPTDRNDQTGQSRPTLKGRPKYIFRSDPTEMVRSIWFLTENFRNFGLNGKGPLFSSLKIGFHVFARKLTWDLISVYIITQLLLANLMRLNCLCDFGTLNKKKKNNWQTSSQISLNIIKKRWSFLTYN